MIPDRVTSFLKSYWTVVALFSAVFVIRMIAAVLLPLEPDEEIYAYIARDIASGDSIFNPSTGVYRAPVFLYMMAMWFKVFGVSFVSARIFAASFSSLSVVAVFFIGKELFDRKAGLIGAAAVGLLPYSIRYNYVVMSEPIQWVFVSFGLLFLIMGVKRERWYFHALSGLFVLLSIGVRRSSFVLPIVMVFFYVWYYRESFLKLFKYCGSWYSSFIASAGIGVGILFLTGKMEWLEKFTNVPNYVQDSRNQNAIFALESVFTKAPILAFGLFVALIIFLHMNSKKKGDRLPLIVGGVLFPILTNILFKGSMGAEFVIIVNVMVLAAVMVLYRSIFVGKYSAGFAAVYLGISYAFYANVFSGYFFNLIILLFLFAIVATFLANRLESGLLRFSFVIFSLVLLLVFLRDEPILQDMIGDASLIILLITAVNLLATKGSDNFSTSILAVSALVVYSFVNLPLFSAGIFTLLSAVYLAGRYYFHRGHIAYKVAIISIGLLFIPFKLYFTPIEFLPVVIAVTGNLIVMTMRIFGSRKLKIKTEILIPVVLVIVFLSGLIVSGEFLDSAFLVIYSILFLSSFYVIDLFGKDKKIPLHGLLIIFTVFLGLTGFYYYRGWKDVYLSEFIVIAAIGLMVIFSRVKFEKRKLFTAGVVTFVLAAGVFSVVNFSQEDFFEPKDMDNRPYGMTIIEIGDWIEDNSDPDDLILSWPCYAVEADRDNIIEPKASLSYNVRQVLNDLRDLDVKIIVQDHYINKGFFKDPDFNSYVEDNFVISEVIDGNVCWVRNS